MSRASPNIVIARTLTALDRAKHALSLGRKRGVPHGTHVTDLAELRKTIILCDRCVRRFDPKRYGYFRDRAISKARGKCDACKDEAGMCDLFIHETAAPQCWTPSN